MTQLDRIKAELDAAEREIAVLRVQEHNPAPHGLDFGADAMLAAEGKAPIHPDEIQAAALHEQDLRIANPQARHRALVRDGFTSPDSEGNTL